MVLLPWPPPPAISFSLQWAGLVRTCLQLAFLPSRSGENYSPVTALDFLKPDQRWDPAGSPSKISAMWSLGVSEVNLGRGPTRLGLQGSEARGREGT